MTRRRDTMIFQRATAVTAGSALLVTAPESVSRFRRWRSVPNVRRVLVAQIPVLFEALVDDPFQFRRHVGIQAHGRHRSAVENRIENRSRAVSAKRPRACGHFIEHDAEREQIGAGVQRLSRGPARATCTPRSRACCPARSTAPQPTRVASSATPVAAGLGAALASPKSTSLTAPSLREDRVRGLDVAMHDAVPMRGVQGIGHRDCDVNEDRDLQSGRAGAAAGGSRLRAAPSR